MEEWDHFDNQPSCKGYSPCKILTLGQKLKLKKTYENPFYNSSGVVLCKIPLQKTLNIREIRPFGKSAHNRRQPMQNPDFGSKTKIAENISKSILQIIWSCSVQKAASKNTKKSRSKIILKIGHNAKARAHAKCWLWVKT